MTDSPFKRFNFTLKRGPKGGDEFLFVIENKDGTTWSLPLTEIERSEMLTAIGTIPLLPEPLRFLAEDTSKRTGRFGL